MEQIIKVCEGDKVYYCVVGDRHGACHGGWSASVNRAEATRFINSDAASKFIADQQIGWGDFSGDFPVVSLEDVGDAS